MIITKSALARELECSPSSITKLADTGLKFRPDGRIDRDAALRFIVNKTSGVRGGWQGEIHGKQSLRERAEKLLASKPRRKGRTVKAAATDHRQTFPPAVVYGMQYLAEKLRDEVRMESLCDLTADLKGMDAAKASEAVLLFVFMVNLWIVDLLGETFGKNHARDFDRGLTAWIKTWTKNRGRKGKP
jgi:hypothetical protein